MYYGINRIKFYYNYVQIFIQKYNVEVNNHLLNHCRYIQILNLMNCYSKILNNLKLL